MSRLRGAPHICYHFAISGGFDYHADGDIMLTNQLTDIVWHTKGQNDTGIGIMLEGDLRDPDHETDQTFDRYNSIAKFEST